MAAPDPTEARFPQLAGDTGAYESFYLKLCHSDEPLGVWIRYTVHKRPGAAPKGSLWFTLFDRAAEGPRARKVTLPEPAAGGADWIRIGESRIGAGEASGAAEGASWDLRFETGERPLFHLPRGWMYSGPLPRTKLLSPAPAARFEGRVTVEDREITVVNWGGMVGHNWGAQHAERWIWLHGLAAEGTWLDAAIGRIKLGPVTTPWVGNGALSIDGERYALGGLGKRSQVSETPTGCEFTLPGAGLSLRGSVRAPKKDFVGWIYADPDGSEHNTVNCSVADMSLTVERDGAPPLDLRVDGAAAYELGMRERDHGMEIQPYPDG
ncbi:MAG TPA: hypothetical protein VGF21_17750 [Thermoleophilaceae bacterium]|jgi:hypothetical protein